MQCEGAYHGLTLTRKVIFDGTSNAKRFASLRDTLKIEIVSIAYEVAVN